MAFAKGFLELNRENLSEPSSPHRLKPNPFGPTITVSQQGKEIFVFTAQRGFKGVPKLKTEPLSSGFTRWSILTCGSASSAKNPILLQCSLVGFLRVVLLGWELPGGGSPGML